MDRPRQFAARKDRWSLRLTECDPEPVLRQRLRHLGNGGYLLVLFVIIVAFVGVAVSMQVLVLTSVATTSRAYDSYRQGATELARLQHAVTETVLDERQISVAPSSIPLADALNQRLTDLGGGSSNITATTIPAALPTITTYPSSTALPDVLAAVPNDLRPFLTPELTALLGPHVVAYPEINFAFSSQRTVLENARTYATQVRARMVAVPLCRFPISAYELPADIGANSAITVSAPASSLPAGLVPPRDPAFIHDLQAQSGVLPYHYRRRAAVAAAYQYVFSQPFIDRVAEYAGITHYCDLDASSGTAVLTGMSKSGSTASWDLALAGNGTYNTITLTSDATVVFTETAGHILHLYDSAGQSNASALFLLVLGPANPTTGTLVVDLATIARPVVIVGYNIRVTAPAGTAVNGALFLDPVSAIAPAGTLTVGHLSYWAGTAGIASGAVAANGNLPGTAEALAPRVVYVATMASRL